MRDFEPVNALETRTRSYPESPTFFNGWSWLDDFNREALSLTNAAELYATSANGSASVSMVSASAVRLTTGTTINSDVNIRTVFGFSRSNESVVLDDRSEVQMIIVFRLTVATAVEAFIGLLEEIAAVTVLPTTADHLGLIVDISSSLNFILSESDGTTQAATDTGVPVDTATHVLRITWSSTGELIELLDTDGNVEASRTVVNSPTVSASRGMPLHGFLENEAAASKSLDINAIKAVLS